MEAALIFQVKLLEAQMAMIEAHAAIITAEIPAGTAKKLDEAVTGLEKQILTLKTALAAISENI